MNRLQDQVDSVGQSKPTEARGKRTQGKRTNVSELGLVRIGLSISHHELYVNSENISPIHTLFHKSGQMNGGKKWWQQLQFSCLLLYCFISKWTLIPWVAVWHPSIPKELKTLYEYGIFCHNHCRMFSRDWSTLFYSCQHRSRRAVNLPLWPLVQMFLTIARCICFALEHRGQLL